MTCRKLSHMNDVKVSVLIPVYGVEPYIGRCAISLFEQTMKDGIEFIFIDDCTCDESISILERVLQDYPNRKSQVRIIRHEQNLGLAEARVTALNAANGQYVIHCDSDDWVEPDMYEQLYKKAIETDADIIGCDYIEEFATKKKIKRQDFSLPQNKMIMEMCKDDGRILGFLWGRLIRRAFYQQGAFRADRGITLLEDLAVTLPMHFATCKVAYVSKPLYHYNRTVANSMSVVFDWKHLKSAFQVFSSLLLLPLDAKSRIILTDKYKHYLFIRALSFHSRDIHQWETNELPIILNEDFHLNLWEKCTIWFVKHKLYFVQYILMFASKTISPKIIHKLCSR